MICVLRRSVLRPTAPSCPTRTVNYSRSPRSANARLRVRPAHPDEHRHIAHRNPPLVAAEVRQLPLRPSTARCAAAYQSDVRLDYRAE
ncbi:hypothetical protein PENSPDRAFT_495348 [Peniophora sp. CONT]|nr:hypothetical protein PENSPDRAFT_495348 [Peniophora sp. CONT]